MKKTIAAILITTSALTAAATAVAADNSASYTGYVLYTGNVIADVNGITQQTQGAVIAKMDGTTETCATLYDKSALLREIVTVRPSDFGVTLSNTVTTSEVSGTVNASAMTIGNKKVSEDIRIMDVAAWPSNGMRNYAVADINRIDGLTLSANDVKYCQTNAAGEITELVLNDVTGDAYNYGVVARDTSISEDIILSGGQKWRCANDTKFGILKYTPVRFAPYLKYDIDMDTNTGRLISYEDTYHLYSHEAPLKLYGVASDIQARTATINGNSYKLSDDVQVFYTESNAYVQTSLESVNSGNYKLSCYYDKAENRGGRIRVIIAEHK